MRFDHVLLVQYYIFASTQLLVMFSPFQTNMEAKGVIEVLEHDLEGLYVKLHNKGDKVSLPDLFFKFLSECSVMLTVADVR